MAVRGTVLHRAYGNGMEWLEHLSWNTWAAWFVGQLHLRNK